MRAKIEAIFMIVYLVGCVAFAIFAGWSGLV